MCVSRTVTWLVQGVYQIIQSYKLVQIAYFARIETAKDSPIL
jgi:hypothetical protein